MPTNADKTRSVITVDDERVGLIHSHYLPPNSYVINTDGSISISAEIDASFDPYAPNARDTLTLLDSFERVSYPSTGSPLPTSLPDRVGTSAWTQAGPGNAAYESRIQSAGNVRVYRRADNAVMSPVPAGNGLYLQQVSGVTPFEIGVEFTFPTFAGNTANPSMVISLSPDALPPNNNMFHVTIASSNPAGGNNGAFSFNIWDASRGYVGISLVPTLTNNQGFGAGTTGIPITAGTAYQLRLMFSGRWCYVSLVTANRTVGEAVAYYDRMTDITGPNFYYQMIDGITTSINEVWTRNRYTQNAGPYAIFPAGLDGTPIGLVIPGPAKFSQMFIDHTGALVPTSQYFNVWADAGIVDSQLPNVPTFQGNATATVRVAAAAGGTSRVSFRGIGAAGSENFSPQIISSVASGNVRLKSAGTGDAAQIELGVTHVAFATNGEQAYTTGPGLAFNSPTGPAYRVAAGAPGALNRANGSLYTRTDGGGTLDPVSYRAGGAWIPIGRLPSFTVATLPAAPGAGDRALVTDALGPAFGVAVVGGGAAIVPVYYSGAAWLVG